MKTKFNRVRACLFCAVALGSGAFLGLAAAAASSLEAVPAKPSPTVLWSQIGTKAGAGYPGDGLAVAPTGEGTRLRCVFQRLEGEATREISFSGGTELDGCSKPNILAKTFFASATSLR